MRYFISLLLCLIAISASATTHVRCYSNGHLVYDGYTKNIYYIDEKSFAFKDRHTKRDVFVWATECILEE